jgi:MGT family glycosyltransferase
MSRFLFTTLPSNDFGLLARSLPIANELRQRGHQVTFCHPARGPQILIREAGFENLLPDDPVYCVLHESLFRLLRKGKRLRTLKALAHMMMGIFRFRTTELWNVDDFNALFLSNLEGVRANIEALAQVIESTKADAVVDFWNPWSCMAARLLKKPLITVIQSHQHPRSPGFIYWKNPPPRLPTAVPLINKLLSDYGLPKIKTSCDLFMGDLTMVVGTPELDPIPDSTNVIYIGAVLWQNPELKIPGWIADLKPDRPVVWIYPGALRYQGGNRQGEILLEACIRALASEDVQVVVSTGHHNLPPSLLPLPPNFRFDAFVPGLTMAKRADLIMHHGGYGSCQTGLYMGTPAVIIPTFSERESNARRIVEQGAGEMVLPTFEASRKKMRVDAAELAGKVRKVLSNPSYKESAKRISAKLKEYGGAPKAAQLIEGAVKSRASVNNRQFSIEK